MKQPSGYALSEALRGNASLEMMEDWYCLRRR